MSKKILFAFILCFTQASFATLSPETLTGSFRVGACAISTAKEATIALENDGLYGKILKLTFQEEQKDIQIFLNNFELDDVTVVVSSESFVLTNKYFDKNQVVYETRLARSATGNRVRFNTNDLKSAEKKECVLYRLK